MTSARLIVLAPCALLLGAVLQMIVARWVSARVKGVLAVLCSVPAVIAAAMALPAVGAGAAIEGRLPVWDGPAALVFHIDALSALFAIMGAGVGAMVLLYSIGYMAQERSATRFYALMLVFIAGFMGLVYSANLLFLYLCWEVVGLCSFSLVGFWYTNPEAVHGARKVLLMTHLAGYGLLCAILVLFHRTGSLLWTDPRMGHAFTTGVFVLMLLSLVAKSVQVPLHTWIPDAMAAPTPVSALLHAACYVKAGVYLAARMFSFGAMPAHAGPVLVSIGTVTMLVGVMYAMVQTDVKRMLAFHTVSQIGYMMTGLGIGTPLAIAAALLHCINHALFKGGLFLCAGSVQHATGTRQMNELGGLAGRMPRTTLFWLINAGGIMGVPLMSGFASKWLLYTAALQAGWIVPALAAWVTSLGTVFSFMKATSAVFLGQPTEKTEGVHEAPGSMQAGLALVAAGTLALGIAPQLAVRFLINPAVTALGMGAGAEVTWFGMASSAGSISVTQGLVLALISVGFGALVWWFAQGLRQPVAGVALAGSGAGIFTGGEPLAGDGRLPADEFSGMLHEQWHAFFAWSNVDKVWAAAGEALTALSRTGRSIVAIAERHAVICLVILAGATLAGVRWLAAPVTGGAVVLAQSGMAQPGMAQPVIAHWTPALLFAACSLALIALLVAALAIPRWRGDVLLMGLAGVLVAGGSGIGDPAWRLVLLESAGAVGAWLVWRAAKTASARWTYVCAFAISAAAMAASHGMEARGELDWARALLLTGIVVKLAAVPMLFWLLRLADEVPALVLGLLIAVVDIAVFGELALAAQGSPWMFAGSQVWIGFAAVSALGGALLMLSERSLKRLLVLSTVEDMGFLLLGVASGSALGLRGAMIGAAVHALAKALLFVALAAPEADGALGETGLASRYPVSGAAFLFGMLAMLGVPPLPGYAARWRLYATALETSPWLLAVFVAASAMALIAYVLALTRVWWGPPAHSQREPDVLDSATAPQQEPVVACRGREHTARNEPVLVRAVLVVLIVILLGAGVWPGVMARLDRNGGDAVSAQAVTGRFE